LFKKVKGTKINQYSPIEYTLILENNLHRVSAIKTVSIFTTGEYYKPLVRANEIAIRRCIQLNGLKKIW
jgi:hypothetical protein